MEFHIQTTFSLPQNILPSIASRHISSAITNLIMGEDYLLNCHFAFSLIKVIHDSYNSSHRLYNLSDLFWLKTETKN